MKLLTYCTKGLAISLPGLADSVFPGFCNSGETAKFKNNHFNNIIITTTSTFRKTNVNDHPGLIQ